MLTINLTAGATAGGGLSRTTSLVLPVDVTGTVLTTVPAVPDGLAAECAAFHDQVDHTGQAGVVHTLPRPLQRPRQVFLTGIGDGQPDDWRAAGAGVARAAARQPSLTIAMPAHAPPAHLRALVEGLQLGSYRYRLGQDDPGTAPRLRRVTITVDDPSHYEDAATHADVVADVTRWARDLTNTPALRKNPDWFARQVQRRADGHAGLRVRVWGVPELREGGFGGILAVGGGSVNPPRLVELSWRPRQPRGHVVLVGKGITFDTGGISLKPANAMVLMRKDMGGAASVVAATIGAARLGLPVRVTALAPLAENMPSGAAVRPGDVVRHFGGKTTEVHNTDAEGRLVLADALAYASRRLRPDVVVDVATLTGAAATALGKRTGALYSADEALASQLIEAAGHAGERVWRMPLADEYAELLRGQVADLTNAPGSGPGSIIGALFLREFVDRTRWAHLDMSAPAWCEEDTGELSRGATGWGVRTLLRWLQAWEGVA